MAKKELTDGQPPKKKSKFKWVLLILFFLLLMGGGAAGAWLFLLDGEMPGFLQKIGGSSPPAASTAPSAPAGPVGDSVPLPVFIVNLADPLGQRFIQLSVEAEVANGQVAQDLQRNMARIRDSVIMLLSSKSYADVATTESKIMLKSEITDRLNTILGPGKVYQVFITDLKVQ
ncbi:MAG: flagellar basal body-associated FliL family protein [Deltaproteobacteria bacterium]|jgi:flagellar FliL protein|nr:flagellar basal body-associated FliL family protein [Deltaproteobacteria bacterium]